jgi:predicted extracellular nuclease
MKKISTFFIIALLFGSFTSFGQVIISQIYEGSSGFNKYIEITNLGTTSVDLASPQLTIKLFSNKTEIGTNAPQATKNLSGTLAPGQCYILRHGSSALPAYACAYTPSDTSSSTANFNGTGSSSNPTASTDIVALYNGATLVDVFSWGTFQYLNQSFYRNAIITGPNATWTVGEWTSVTNAVVDGAAINTIERLGYHTSGGVTTPSVIISSPTTGSTVYTANVDVAYSLYNFTIPTDGHIHYTIDGGTAVEYSGTSPIALTALAAGSHKVVITLADPSHVALVPKAADSVTFTVDLTPPVLTSIYDIQYTTTPPYDSPFKDTTVITSGIVTASFAAGYYIQDGTTPWNGLYVYDATHTPAVGDSIIVGGTISEYYNLTELGTITIFSTIASGKPLPLPIDLTTNTVKSEQYEGMLVKLTNAKCTQIIPGGRWKVFQGSDTCYIGKLMYSFTTAVLGSYYNVTGCLNYTFDQFTIEPRSASDVSLYVGVKENELSKINLFPNPVTSELNIANMEGIQQIKIANLLGEVVGTYNVSGNSTAINVNSLPRGIYFISLWKDNSVSVTRKFIKQ